MQTFKKCCICPRKCGVSREKNVGFCGVKHLPIVAKAFLHMWEEPCISGTRGSGTVFFSGCNLKCVFCQNYMVSQQHFGKEITVEQLGKIFLSLQEKGAHNINLVNPTHYVLQIREALEGGGGLSIPAVYNSNGYETIEGLRVMDGCINIYLPDLKYYSGETAEKFSSAPNYFETACTAILEMYRQVGGAEFDMEGILQKGLVIRHLVLPGLTGESLKILDWIKQNLPGDIIVSIMSQYTPYYKAENFPEINRRIIRREYEKVVNHFLKLDFQHGYVQERESAAEEYIPDFNLEGVE